jgi:hypothetical protein
MTEGPTQAAWSAWCEANADPIREHLIVRIGADNFCEYFADMSPEQQLKELGKGDMSPGVSRCSL